ncbi:MAG: hypothetical protein IPL53_00670 [Ignavibacteria bacterium]|nr:hypothetical protein [Ignavibacteria bacterium]
MISFVLCTLSLTAMLILPFGNKGGVYHRAVSSLGLILYIAVLIIEN